MSADRDRTRRVAGLASAIILIVLYAVLGRAVSSQLPRGLDAAAMAMVGQATRLAAFLTFLGRFPVYATVCAIVIVAGLVRRKWLGRCLTSVLLLIVAELTSDAFKVVFHRPRPLHWLVTHETSFSYASGHATNSIVFYGFWAYVAVRSQLPAAWRVTLVALMLGLSAAIGWSRLALGAHFPSDVLGGYLLGLAILTFGLALVPSRILGLERPKSELRTGGKSSETVGSRA